MIRSFLAIELPKEILKRIEEIQRDLRSSHADVRWVSPEKIHLTLKFFGNVEEPQIESIVKAIEGSVQRTQVFSIKVKGIGAFPHLKNPRVIWIGLVDGQEALIPIQKELEADLEGIGFEPEGRPFQPHLTLGRMNSNRGKDGLIQKMERYQDETLGDLKVERVVLFRSDLKPTGPVYTPLREVKLKGS